MLPERVEMGLDKPDNDGRTPPSYAVGNGYAKVGGILLHRDDVNPSKRDVYGQTPLLLATRHNHTAVLALLRPGGPSVT